MCIFWGHITFLNISCFQWIHWSPSEAVLYFSSCHRFPEGKLLFWFFPTYCIHSTGGHWYLQSEAVTADERWTKDQHISWGEWDFPGKTITELIEMCSDWTLTQRHAHRHATLNILCLCDRHSNNNQLRFPARGKQHSQVRCQHVILAVHAQGSTDPTINRF